MQTIYRDSKLSSNLMMVSGKCRATLKLIADIFQRQQLNHLKNWLNRS